MRIAKNQICAKDKQQQREQKQICKQQKIR